MGLEELRRVKFPPVLGSYKGKVMSRALHVDYNKRI